MKVSALILAGGESRRMGQDKRLLRFRGVPLVVRACRSARMISDDIWLLLADLKDQGRLRPLLQGDVRYLEDPDPGSGPMGALAGALSHVDAGYALLLAVDYPLMTGRFLAGAKEALEACSPPPEALVPLWRGKPQVTCAFYRTSLAKSLREAFSGGERSLKRWISRADHRVAYLPEEEWGAFGDRDVFFNVNTREDRARLERLKR